MPSRDSIQIGPNIFRIGQRVRMLVSGMGCDGKDNELSYEAGAIATVVQIERYSNVQGLGVGVELDIGIFNMFDGADEPPLYPFVPIPSDSLRSGS